MKEKRSFKISGTWIYTFIIFVVMIIAATISHYYLIDNPTKEVTVTHKYSVHKSDKKYTIVLCVPPSPMFYDVDELTINNGFYIFEYHGYQYKMPEAISVLKTKL